MKESQPVGGGAMEESQPVGGGAESESDDYPPEFDGQWQQRPLVTITQSLPDDADPEDPRAGERIGTSVKISRNPVVQVARPDDPAASRLGVNY
jgi:hypothetical protein